METTKFRPLTGEEFSEVCEQIKLPPKFKAVLDYVFRARSTTLATLMASFPDLCENPSPEEFLSVIGRINGKIFSKQTISIYPAEVSSTMEDSVFSLGILVKIKDQKGS